MRDEKNNKGKEWDFGHSQRMNFFIESEFNSIRNTVGYEDIIASSGKLLKYPNTGSTLYDILLEIFDTKPSIDRIKYSIKDLVGTVGIYDFILETRNMIIREDYGGTVLSKLMRVVILILKGYNLGRVQAVDSAKRRVLMFDAVDPMDLKLLITCEINKRHDLKKKLVNIISIYGTDLKKHEKYFRSINASSAVEQFATLSDKQLITLANNFSSGTTYAYIGHWFFEFNEDFNPDYELISSANWEREDTHDSSSAIMIHFKFLVCNVLTSTILKERKFFVREKGVTIKFNIPTNGFDSLDVREYHSPDDAECEEHYLTIFYRVEKGGGSRMLYIDMTDLESSTVALMYEKDVDVILMVMNWLGVLDTINITPELVDKKLNKEHNEHVTEKDIVKFTNDINRLLDVTKNVMNPDNFKYFAPMQWNYENIASSKSSIFGSSKPEQRKLVKVGKYSRKLPHGQNASPEALSLARRSFIELKEGYTIVDEHEKLTRGSKT